MVSLRKMSSRTNHNGGGKRRSARIIALEEQKSEAARAIVPANTTQPPNQAQGNMSKRGRKKKDYHEEETDRRNLASSSSNPFGVENPIDRIIEQILDMLEVKDAKELFSMPDEFQTIDYMERVTKPGDFATLRQKHKDGAYSTLDQFETDVYMVFKKAIESNDENSVPYKEANSLYLQAKQVFQSLRNNRTYAELELATWHQKSFPSKRATRSDTIARSSIFATLPSNSAHLPIRSGMKQSNVVVGLAANANNRILKGSQTVKGNTQFGASLGCRIRRGRAACSKSPEEPRRNTYLVESDSRIDPIIAMAFQRPQQISHNESAPSYKESLLRFVKDSGQAAKKIANLQILKHEQQPFASYTRPYIANGKETYYDFVSGSTINEANTRHLKNPSRFSGTSFVPSSLSKGMAPAMSDSTLFFSATDDMDEFGKTPPCKLETDELARLFCAVGTPMFLERGEKILRVGLFKSAVPHDNLNRISAGAHLAASTAKPTSGGFSSRIKDSLPPQREQTKSTSFLNLSSALPATSESKILSSSASLNLADKEYSGALGFSQFASPSHPFKSGTLNPFAKLTLR